MAADERYPDVIRRGPVRRWRLLDPMVRSRRSPEQARRLPEAGRRMGTVPRASVERDRAAAELLVHAGGRDGVAAIGRWDAGSRAAALVSLQRSAGNRAVQAALAAGQAPSRTAPTVAPATRPSVAPPATIDAQAHARPAAAVLPVLFDLEAIQVSLAAGRSAPAAPAGGLQQIRDQVPGTRAAGYTSLPAPDPPALVVGEPELREDGWVAKVQPTRVGSDRPESLYPAPGVHDIPPGPTGQQRHLDVTPAMSDLIRVGEGEHLADLEWARHLSYDRAAAAVNALADQGAPAARTAEAARQAASRAVCAALPAQLRWRAGGDPVGPWVRAYSQLAAMTVQRDANHWHDITSAFVLDPADKRRLGVPVEDEVTRYVSGPGIGRHPSAPLVRGRFAELAE